MAYEIIGISGTSASGKDTAAEHLASLGFMHVSTAEVIRAEARRMHGTEDQYVLRQVAHEMRAKNGPGAMVLKAVAQYQESRADYEGVVVSGIRAVGPAQAVKDEGGLMVAIDAPTELRYARTIPRNRPGESRTFKEFIQFEADEFNGSLSTGQDVRAVQAMSNVNIYNDSDLASFIANVERAVGIQQQLGRGALEISVDL